MISEVIEFVKAVIKGDEIDIITSGAFIFIALMVISAIIVPLAIKKRYNIKRIILIYASLLTYSFYFSYQYMPLFLEKTSTDFSGELILGQMWPPLFQLNFFDDFAIVVNIYLVTFIELLVFGFLITFTYKKIHKLRWFSIGAISITLIEIVYVLIVNYLSDGVTYIYDLTLPFFELPAMYIGFLLAKVLIILNKKAAESIFEPKSKRIKETNI